MTPLFSSLRRELKFSRTTPTYTRRAHLTLTCTSHKPKLNLLASCCSLPDGSKYSCVLSTLKEQEFSLGSPVWLALVDLLLAGKQVNTDEKLNQSLVSSNHLPQLIQPMRLELCLEVEGSLVHGFLSQPLC